MKISKSIYPNAFTFGNMFCGLAAIIQSFNGNFEWAAYLILIGALLDAFDGMVARLVKASSAIGVQLDSLADVITFGVAPSILVYKLSLESLGWLGLFISGLIMMGGAYRLARFNVQLVGFDKDHFVGLPIPAQAATLCAFILSENWFENLLGVDKQVVLIPLVILLAFLMVSVIKYDTLPKFNSTLFTKKPMTLIVLVLFLLLIILLQIKGVFIGLILYILFGIIRSLTSGTLSKK